MHYQTLYKDTNKERTIDENLISSKINMLYQAFNILNNTRGEGEVINANDIPVDMK